MSPKVRKTIRINGKRVSRYFRTKEAADRWYRKVSDQKDAIKAGMDLPPEWITVKDFAAKFINSRKKTKKISIGSWINDEGRMRLHVLPAFGDRYLHDIDAQEWENFFSQITVVGRFNEKTKKEEKPLSISTSNRVRALISRMYNEAMRAKPPHVSRNPIALVRPFEERKRRIAKIKANLFQTKEEMQRFLKAASEEEPGYLVYHMIGFNTGLRKSEKVALQWGDYDDTKGVIRVRRHYLSHTYEIEEGTKTFEEGEDYAVGVNQMLAQVLAWWRARTAYKSPTDWICSRADGSHFEVWHLRRAQTRILKRAGLKRVTDHGIRHSFATHFLQAGGTLEELKELYGHKSIATSEIYSHVLEDSLPSKANKLNIGADLVSRFCHQNGGIKKPAPKSKPVKQ